MLRKLLILSSLIAICSTGFAQANINPVAILDGKVTLKLPASFTEFKKDASRLLWKTTYPVTAISLIENGETFLEYTYADKNVDDNGIPAFTDELITLFPQERRYSKKADDGIYLVNGKNIGYFKIVLKEKGDHTFHYFFYLSVEGRLLLFHFATPAKMRKNWEAAIDVAANSIAVKEK